MSLLGIEDYCRRLRQDCCYLYPAMPGGHMPKHKVPLSRRGDSTGIKLGKQQAVIVHPDMGGFHEFQSWQCPEIAPCQKHKPGFQALSAYGCNLSFVGIN